MVRLCCLHSAECCDMLAYWPVPPAHICRRRSTPCAQLTATCPFAASIPRACVEHSQACHWSRCWRTHQLSQQTQQQRLRRQQLLQQGARAHAASQPLQPHGAATAQQQQREGMPRRRLQSHLLGAAPGVLQHARRACERCVERRVCVFVWGVFVRV